MVILSEVYFIFALYELLWLFHSTFTAALWGILLSSWFDERNKYYGAQRFLARSHGFWALLTFEFTPPDPEATFLTKAFICLLDCFRSVLGIGPQNGVCGRMFCCWRELAINLVIRWQSYAAFLSSLLFNYLAKQTFLIVCFKLCALRKEVSSRQVEECCFF